MPPDRLLADRYVLAELLGTGGMADVHRAWDTRLQRHVAVKLFHNGSEVSHERRFDNEVRTLASLSHPRLVDVHDAGTSDGTPFVVLQLIDGCTLRERINSAPLTVGEVRLLGADLAEALAHVHETGVVHRDIKPSNILLDEDGNAHLADFGLARLVGTTRLTRSDQVVGTAAYLAPEQVRGEDPGSAVDVYALGLVLLECLTGRREFEGSEIESAVARLHRRPAVPDDLPTDLHRLLTLMTSLSPRRRPTAADCARILRASDDSATHIALPQPRRRLHHVLKAAAVATLVATAGLTAVALAPQPPVESAPAPSTPSAPAATTTAPPAAVPVPVAVAVEQQAEVTSPQQVQPVPQPKAGKPASPPGKKAEKAKGPHGKR
ncbi:serine/threonine-protein kinase [Lentzea sp. NPDC042327]|uniref:serine/threonine-protein kinase n=1 Tax=Lentzea sp. NPDC042327 TaxID=3154801 RepID=UPI0033D38C8A